MARKSPLLVDALDDIARRFVGDGGGLNAFFVSDEHGHVDTVSFDFETAYVRWRHLAAKTPRRVYTLEDRLTGVLASVEPLSDDPQGRLHVFDDTSTFGYPKE